MRAELEEKLFGAFPKLYEGRGKPPLENLLCFGLECGDGWFQLLWRLSEKLQGIAPEARAVQVKEKFGGLRFYLETSTEEIFNEVEKFEEESFRVCESCGVPGELRRKRGWLRTLCKPCMEREGYESFGKARRSRVDD